MKSSKCENAREIIKNNQKDYEVTLNGLITGDIDLYKYKDKEKYYGKFWMVCFSDNKNFSKKVKCFNLTEEAATILYNNVVHGSKISLQGRLHESHVNKNGERKSSPDVCYIPKILTICKEDESIGIQIDLSEEYERNKNFPIKKNNNNSEEDSSDHLLNSTLEKEVDDTNNLNSDDFEY